MLIYPLTRGRELGWPLWGHLCMAGSLIVFAAFVMYEKYKTRKDSSPLVELSRVDTGPVRPRGDATLRPEGGLRVRVRRDLGGTTLGS